MNSNLERLEDVFKKMQTNSFNVEADLKWGFYFIDYQKEKLVKIFDELKENNYKIESLKLNDENLWQLHVSKIDMLTPEKLHKRNEAFNELADFFEIFSYDGWDVEKI
ncbi:MAG: ribonuclease E inhibitor RraB [Chitinophagaceae bacterium]|nr:ribonuclease E inhibitor RraB [Chitinophagaceae bacterium]